MPATPRQRWQNRVMQGIRRNQQSAIHDAPRCPRLRSRRLRSRRLRPLPRARGLRDSATNEPARPRAWEACRCLLPALMQCRITRGWRPHKCGYGERAKGCARDKACVRNSAQRGSSGGRSSRSTRVSSSGSHGGRSSGQASSLWKQAGSAALLVGRIPGGQTVGSGVGCSGL